MANPSMSVLQGHLAVSWQYVRASPGGHHLPQCLVYSWKPTKQSESEMQQVTAKHRQSVVNYTAVNPTGAGWTKSAVLRTMLWFGFSEESADDRDIMEASIIVQIKENFFFFFFFNTSVCIWKRWIVWKWSNFSKGLEALEVFIPSADADTQPWIFSQPLKIRSHT